jgi:hypothetical protein
MISPTLTPPSQQGFESVMKAAENSGTQAATFVFDCSPRCAYEAQRLRDHSVFVFIVPGDFVVG